MNSANTISLLKKYVFNFLPKKIKEPVVLFYRNQRYLRCLNIALRDKSELMRLISECKSGVLIDVTNQKIMWEKNRQSALPIGSMTKIMTALVILEEMKTNPQIGLQTRLMVGERFDDIGQTIGLKIGQSYTVEQLLAGSIIYSANDCVDLLVRNFFDGKSETFVKKMNERSKELGLLNTIFYNPHGLEPFPGTYWKNDNLSPAQDVAYLTEFLISTYPSILRYSSALELDFMISESHFARLKNTNHPLLCNYAKCDGFKTGYTTTAGYCLSGTSKSEGVRYIAVVMGMSSELYRNVLVNALLELGQSNAI